MRIVSLLPAGSEIVFALGLGDQLVGRSLHCDFPPDVLEVPTVTTWPSGEHAPAVTAPAVEGASLSLARLGRVAPDLVIAPEHAHGGLPGAQALRVALRERGLDVSVVGLDPRSLEGILNSIASVGAFAEAEDEAVGLIELLRERLGMLENRILERRLEGIASRRVVVLTSLDPPIAAGRWIPELVRRAGGWELLGREGDDAEPADWRRLREVDPEVLVLAPDGDALAAADAFADASLPAWFDDLPAVQDGELFAVDGRLLGRPGPRVIEGIAMLAELFDPEGFAGLAPARSWIPLAPSRIGFTGRGPG